MSTRRRIGAVHALLDSIAPTEAAFARQWPSADVAHLLDGSLYLDRSRGTADADELAERIRRLLAYSAATGADGILFTGSFFGAAVRQARSTLSIPVATSFEGLIERALDDEGAQGPIHVLSTAAESVRLLTAELGAATAHAPRVIDGRAVAGAMAALLTGDAAEHDRRVAAAVRAAPAGATVLFAQFSMERALEACRAETAGSVIGPATEGVARLRRLLG